MAGGRNVPATHERLDGSGYPQGLASDAIAAEVRILGVVDACIRVFRRNGFHFQQYP